MEPDPSDPPPVAGKGHLPRVYSDAEKLARAAAALELTRESGTVVWIDSEARNFYATRPGEHFTRWSPSYDEMREQLGLPPVQASA